MGSGDRTYRTLAGESKAIQEHQLAMLPIMQQQFEQEFAQIEKLNLLALQLQPEPILVPSEVTETKPAASKYLVYAGLAALAYFFLR